MKNDLHIFIFFLLLTFTGYAIGQLDASQDLEQERSRRVHAEIVAEYANSQLNLCDQDNDFIKQKAGHLEQQLIQCKYF